ncbi:MAG: histidinol-phosphatase [Pleurocapsa sp. SU_196_0]|nr:histidinol-phosphatase [Pleurocapsa sp. SU_196_0]
MTNLNEYLEVAVNAARIGGKRTLAYFGAGVTVETKADNTPVTIADREAEIAIRAQIKSAFPHHSIVGEEGGLEDGVPEFKWIIDPIDGTKSFIRGVPLYGVLIGLEIEGKSSVGAVYLPATDEMLYAASGHGTFLNGRPVRVSNTKRLEDATLLTTSVESARRKSGAYDELASRVQLVRGWGDCYGYVMVATGRADIMLDAGMNVWDCAPMLPILEEAGGWFTDWAGNTTIYGRDAFGTNGALHDDVLEILRR